MGIASVGPGVDLVIFGRAIAFRQYRGKGGQISLDLYKINIRDLVPLCFEWSPELSPKRFELLVIHLTLLHDMVNKQVLPTTTALVRSWAVENTLEASEVFHAAFSEAFPGA
jgi:hypothetical protein